MKGGRFDWGGVSLSLLGWAKKGLVGEKFFGSVDFDFARLYGFEPEID